MYRGTENQRLWSSTNVFTEFPTDEDMLTAWNEHADANMLDIKTEVDDEVWDYVSWLTRDYWDEKFEGALNLKNVVVTGYFGAWNGKKQIVPCRCKDLKEAIEKCCDVTSQWDADLYFEKDENGWEHLICQVSHHDGACHYEISLLVNADEMDEDDDPREYKLKAITHKMVFGC